MADNLSQYATRVTLLGRLEAFPNDPAAWAEFVEWYGRKIYVWCRGWGLQEADAQDVTQDVFLNLSARMHDFRYDPRGSFRAWLKTLTHHAWHDYRTRQRRPGRGSGSESVVERLETIAARDDLERRLALAFDEELLKEAAARVQLRVEPRTWRVPASRHRRQEGRGSGGVPGDEGRHCFRRSQQGATNAPRRTPPAGRVLAPGRMRVAPGAHHAIVSSGRQSCPFLGQPFK